MYGYYRPVLGCDTKAGILCSTQLPPPRARIIIAVVCLQKEKAIIYPLKTTVVGVQNPRTNREKKNLTA